MAVLTRRGRKINWSKPPRPTTLVMWSKRTTSGKKIVGSLRTIAHLDHLNILAVKKYGTHIRVFQGPYNTGVRASKGTHDFDACWDVDIPGVPWSEQERFFRANGAGAWHRKPPSFINHIHGFTLPPREGRDVSDDFKIAGFKVGKYVDGGWSLFGRRTNSSQIEDYYNHRTGLKGHLPAGGWFPKDIRATIFNLNAYIARRRGPAPASGTRVDGVDISHHQSGALNMAAGKASGVKWVYHKATEGATYRDPNYVRRRAEAAKAGLHFGAYHFARPSSQAGDAEREAKFFLDTAKPLPGDMLPVLDIEVTDGLSMGAVRAWVKNFSNAVHRALGVRPILYTNSSWDLGYNEKNHIIWRARYNNTNTPPVRRWDIWQFSNGVYGNPNSIIGFGKVDLNTMRPGLTVAQLRVPVKRAR